MGVPTSSRRYVWRRHLQDGGAGNDVNQDLGRPFRSPLSRWRKMAALPLPTAILDDLIPGTGNEVIQDGGRKRKGRHFPPPPQWGSKRPPYTTPSFYGCSIEVWGWISKFIPHFILDVITCP